MNFTVLRLDTIGSTNDEAANQARVGADEGLCVIAAQQTAGRGRHGRAWVSEPGAGLYFSIVLRPKIEPRLLPLITLVTGVAVYDTLKEQGIEPDIKWVNDVLVRDKKISGILAETVETALGLAVVVGIGINLTRRCISEEIADTATSVETEAGPAGANEIEGGLIKYLQYWYEILNGVDGPREIIEAWQRRSSYFSGKPIRVTLAGEAIEGVTDGLEANGALRVQKVDGSVAVVQAGDVERLRTTGED